MEDALKKKKKSLKQAHQGHLPTLLAYFTYQVSNKTMYFLLNNTSQECALKFLVSPPSSYFYKELNTSILSQKLLGRFYLWKYAKLCVL